MSTVDTMLEKYQPGDMDVLVLPEMAFTGYVFKTLEEIAPYLEDPEHGPSVTWAKRQAIRLKCYVIVGYPETVTDASGSNVNYNSLCCVDPTGNLVKTYRKAFLFETDEGWAEEGPGFSVMDIDEFGKVGFGICMDVNPYQFKSDFRAFEFANYHVEQKTDVIFCCMSWLQSSTDKDIPVKETERTSVLKIINYWAMRLLPIYEHNQSNPRHTYFVAANRTGSERGSNFAGGSCVLDICSSSMQLLGYLSKTEQSILIVDTEEP
ncbi:carbon-nitrogen hydrolase [Radiomyces spectabilis]|uniref:carbon-nitrogen hydrolase n=1 Tax=Radiomyces spectabilis TaxID=64574 RepID=UPI00221EA58C|nr:carbon-nitrogen hydrolase [Radiomyces spectabilis]KAI8388369.1 carbon-nitrogen hydrolase [Radiomyces spectabilis]